MTSTILNEKEVFNTGYKYAEEMNASMANIYPEPKEPTIPAELRPAFDKGYEKFWEEVNSAP